jgi:hypothetical protein
MSRVIFEPTIPAFERARIFRALDRPATMIYPVSCFPTKMFMYFSSLPYMVDQYVSPYLPPLIQRHTNTGPNFSLNTSFSKTVNSAWTLKYNWTASRNYYSLIKNDICTLYSESFTPPLLLFCNWSRFNFQVTLLLFCDCSVLHGFKTFSSRTPINKHSNIIKDVIFRTSLLFFSLFRTKQYKIRLHQQ